MPITTSVKERAYAAAHFALELDGKREVGLFKSIEGGGVKADVMTYQNGANYDRWRTLGKQKYEDLKLQVGMAMSEPFFAWIERFFDGNADRKDGAIVAADFYYQERARREFTGGLIKELTFPKLDATDKNPAYLAITIAVEDIQFKPGKGEKIVQSLGWAEQKLWTACNFELQFDGFDANACRRVSKIDSFTIKQNILEYHDGTSQKPSKTPSQIDFPNLSFYVPEVDAHSFMEHFTKRAMNYERELFKHTSNTGKGGAKGKSGQIQTFDNGHNPLFTVEFYDAEIIGVTPDKSDAGSEEIKQVKFDLWTERMTFAHTPQKKK